MGVCTEFITERRDEAGVWHMIDVDWRDETGIPHRNLALNKSYDLARTLREGVDRVCKLTEQPRRVGWGLSLPADLSDVGRELAGLDGSKGDDEGFERAHGNGVGIGYYDWGYADVAELLYIFELERDGTPMRAPLAQSYTLQSAGRSVLVELRDRKRGYDEDLEQLRDHPFLLFVLPALVELAGDDATSVRIIWGSI